MSAEVSTAAGRARWMPVWIAFCALGTAVALRLATIWHWPLPFCLLRRLTGVPCPACGSTRSLLAWTHFDPVGAFAFNPLFCLSCVVGAGWLLLQFAEQLTGRTWASRAERIARQFRWGRMLAALAALNWIYLCFNLPK